MPITSVLGRLNHREHKAEGLLKAASHLILKNNLPQKQNPSFFNNSLVFVNSKRLSIDQLWNLRCSFCLLLPCLPSHASPTSGNSHPALCTGQLLSTFCPPLTPRFVSIKSDLHTHTCKSPRLSCLMSHAKNSYFNSSQLYFESVRGFHQAVTALSTSSSLLLQCHWQPCIESSRWMNFQGPLVTWNKLYFPFTIKFSLWLYL